MQTEQTWSGNSQATAQTPNSLYILLKQTVQVLNFSDFFFIALSSCSLKARLDT